MELNLHPTQHLSEEQLERYVDKLLSPDDVVASSNHLVECDECSRRLRLVRAARGSLPTMHLIDMVGGHPPVDLIERFVSRNTNTREHREVSEHLILCSRCANEVAMLKALQYEANDPVPKALVALAASSGIRSQPMTRHRLLTHPGLSLATGIAGALLVYAGVQPRLAQIPPLRRQQSITQSQLKEKERELTEANDALERQRKNAGESRSNPLVSEDSEITPLPSDLFPPVVQMGGNASQSRQILANMLLKPVRIVVLEERPVLTWVSDPEAQEYLVTLLEDRDGKLEPVFEKELKVRTPRVQTPVRLHRGGLYLWQVTVHRKNGTIVQSDSAYFRVLDAKRAKQITAAISQSSLITTRSLLRTGLLDEAQEVLDRLATVSDASPGTDAERKRLQRIIDMRRKGTAPE